MIKHKPEPRTNIKIDGVVYKCDCYGFVYLPKEVARFNPIIKKKKKEVVDGE